MGEQLDFTEFMILKWEVVHHRGYDQLLITDYWRPCMTWWRLPKLISIMKGKKKGKKKGRKKGTKSQNLGIPKKGRKKGTKSLARDADFGDYYYGNEAYADDYYSADEGDYEYG